MIGVLALQGGFAEHQEILDGLNLPNKQVRTLEDAEGITGLVIPGGESTVMHMFLKEFGLEDWLRNLKVPVFGTCAGLIVLVNLGCLDAEVERNAYGRQLASFETDFGHFIRAPRIRSVGAEVEVLQAYEGEAIFIRQANFWGCSFHPELVGNSELHARIFS
jgi:5'-phosphate synthase pdxT subunit